PSQISQENQNLRAQLGSLQAQLQQARAESDALRDIRSERRKERRLVTPDQNRGYGRAGPDRGLKRQSFEEYLHHARIELSELGSVISANELLFAQKIQEHVGDLQMAKDQLADEYKQKLDALLEERARLEKDVAVRQATELATARDRLAASYSVETTEVSDGTLVQEELTPQRATALKAADARLVAEYNRRVVKRQSQLALKHAEEFQALTEQYDARIAVLLGDKDKLDGDLSIEPDRYEQLSSEIVARSTLLVAERERSVPSSPLSTKRSLAREEVQPHEQTLQTPMTTPAQTTITTIASPEQTYSTPRSSFSTPADTTSNPPSIPYRNRRPPEQPSPTQRHTPSTNIPIRAPTNPFSTRTRTSLEGSSQRAPSAADGPIPRRVVTQPRASDRWASPS
ncbi:hypothetical protein LTR28_001434, partial [Elasticomyces elasticus]